MSHQQGFGPISRGTIKCPVKLHTFYRDRLWQVWDWEYGEEELADGLGGERALPREKTLQVWERCSWPRERPGRG